MKSILSSTIILVSGVIAFSLFTQMAQADSYRGELSLDVVSDDIEGDMGAIGFKWYFQPVTTSFKKVFKKSVSHPLGEADFLEQASNFSVQYHSKRFDDLSEFSVEKYGFDKSKVDLSDVNKLDLSSTTAAIEYFVPESIFYVGIQYYRTTLETSDVNSTDVNLNTWGITGGLMITDNFLVSTQYKQDQDTPINCSAKYVAELGGGTAVNFLASYSRVEENKPTPTNINNTGDPETEESEEKQNVLTVSADYYFTREFSIGTGLIYAEKTGYELRAQHFFTDKVSLRGTFKTIDDNNTYALGVSARL